MASLDAAESSDRNLEQSQKVLDTISKDFKAKLDTLRAQ